MTDHTHPMNIQDGESLFPYIRLILPQLDNTSRQRYNMKEASIAEYVVAFQDVSRAFVSAFVLCSMYIAVYNLASDSVDARSLRNYRVSCYTKTQALLHLSCSIPCAFCRIRLDTEGTEAACLQALVISVCC